MNREYLQQFDLKVKDIDLSGTNAKQYEWYDGDKPVCTVQIFDWWDGKNLAGLEVYPEYRGLGISYSILDYAINILGARNLAVERSNSIAKHVYDKYGFHETEEDDKYIYMTYVFPDDNEAPT